MNLSTQISNLKTIMETVNYSKIETKTWSDYKANMNLPISYYAKKYAIVGINRAKTFEDKNSGEFSIDIELVFNILNDSYAEDFVTFENAIQTNSRFFNLDDVSFEFFRDYVVVRISDIQPIIT